MHIYLINLFACRKQNSCKLIAAYVPLNFPVLKVLIFFRPRCPPQAKIKMYVNCFMLRELTICITYIWTYDHLDMNKKNGYLPKLQHVSWLSYHQRICYQIDCLPILIRNTRNDSHQVLVSDFVLKMFYIYTCVFIQLGILQQINYVVYLYTT